MYHKLYQYYRRAVGRRYRWPELSLCLLLALSLFVMPVSAAQPRRLQNRSLYMQSSLPHATTSYTVSLRYMSPEAVGSLDMLFCVDPIPYHACVTPPGLDVSNAVLSQQVGESGFSILSKSTNHIILTRPPSMIMAGDSSYTLKNIVNSTDTSQAFSIRLRSHQTTNATGPQIDFGSVRGQITNGIVIETQVPPMLIFCMAQVVEDNCSGTNETYYTDMGLLDSRSTLLAQSQMAVGTNASAGFVITANGTPLSAGTSVVDSLAAPTKSIPGDNQFGINLVANNAPPVGNNPEGVWTNAVPASDYGVPDHYKYVSGDIVAYSPNVSLMKRFTVSYIVNSRNDLRPGVYTTTITFIASGRF